MDDAPKQVALGFAINRPALMGPAAIQAPSPMQMLASNVQRAIKENSESSTNFEHIQAVLAMSKASGKYFDSLSINDQEIFKSAVQNTEVPRDRVVRMVNKIKELFQLPDKELAYEGFLEFAFGATIIESE